MPFTNPLVAGTALVRSAINSPDYVPGVSGWAIKRDGSAEFTRLTVRSFISGRFVDVDTFSNPDRTVIDFRDGRTATLTLGCRTVLIDGLTPRVFTEQKYGPTSDLFARTLSGRWGTTPAAGVWKEFGGSTANFSVSGGFGLIVCTTTGVSRYVRLNDVVGAAVVKATVTTDTMPAGNSNSVSTVFGWQDSSNHYRARLTLNPSGAVAASITVLVNGVETTLAGPATVGAGYVAGQEWCVQAVTDGAGTLAMAAWDASTVEPGNQLTVSDTTYLTGRVGLRAFASTGATNSPTFKVSKYEVNAEWPTPPTVASSSYVYLMPTAYLGFLDVTVADWLTETLASSDPDLLSTAMNYITGGATDADYGPLYSPGRVWDVGHVDDGTRQEGADWNDYLGVTGSYPDLTIPATDNAEAHQLGCLDCSGYVRMVFGNIFGMPMALDDSADYNGLRIPRVSGDIIASGPGNVIAEGAPPVLTAIQPGDILGWDADTSNPDEEEGQIDHIGIYLGEDQDGQHRFLSSRKTANGPTLGDLGGPSIIGNGTGLYARSLRIIRRF